MPYRLALAAALLAAAAPAADPLVLVQTIPLKGVAGKLDHLAVDPAGKRLFVANKPHNSLDVVDLAAGRLDRQIAGQGKVSGICYSPELKMVYVGNGAGTCNAFACDEGYKPVFSTPLAGADNVQYHAGTMTVYVGAEKTLAALDARTGAVKARLELPGGVKGFRIDEPAGKLFVVLGKPDALAVVDAAAHKLLAKYPLTKAAGGSPIAYDAAGGRVYIGCPKSAAVVVLDAKTGEELTSVAIPGGIDDLHFDAERSRLYAACGDGFLAVLGRAGDQYMVTAKLPQPKDSRTGTWGGGRFYLGVPLADGRPPEVRVYEAGR